MTSTLKSYLSIGLACLKMSFCEMHLCSMCFFIDKSTSTCSTPQHLLLSSENKKKYIAKMRKKIDVNRFTPLWAVIFFDPLMICTCHKKGGASTVN